MSTTETITQNVPQNFRDDIPLSVAINAYSGSSFDPEKRGAQAREDYQCVLAADFEAMRENAAKGGTPHLLDEQFARYRAGFRKRYIAWLNSKSRFVSSFICGPAKYPVDRMQKRSRITDKRSTELVEFRSRAKAAIARVLLPAYRNIYAGDADAIDRLTADIDKAEAEQERMKAANAVIRANFKKGQDAMIAALLDVGVPLAIAGLITKPDCYGGYGYASFKLTNNSANIRRMRARFGQITRLRAQPRRETKGEFATVAECPDENRVRVFFDGKPNPEVRDVLKKNCFRWTPSLGCWQAYLSTWHSVNTAYAVAGAKRPAA